MVNKSNASGMGNLLLIPWYVSSFITSLVHFVNISMIFYWISYRKVMLLILEVDVLIFDWWYIKKAYVTNKDNITGHTKRSPPIFLLHMFASLFINPLQSIFLFMNKKSIINKTRIQVHTRETQINPLQSRYCMRIT